MPIYTSIPTRPNVTPSDKFRERGNQTDMACPIYETSIFGNTKTGNTKLSAFRGNFPYHVAANMLQKTIKGVGFVNTAIPQASSFVPLAPTPPVGLSLPGMNAPGNKQTLNSLGFTEESVGGRKFYRGVIELSGLPRVMQMNPVMDNGVPFGVCNLQGLMSFFWISALVGAGYASFANRATRVRMTYGGTYVDDLYHASPITSRLIPIIIKSNQEIPKGSGGNVFPYFDGLVLPDKVGPIRFLLGRLSMILGDTPQSSAEATHHLLQGWKSVSSTSSGMALSHIIFGLDLALQTGTCPAIIHSPDGDYQGFVLFGTLYQIIKGSSAIVPLEEAELKIELRNLDTHGAALRAIVEIINGYKEDPKDEDSDYYTWSAAVISLPRQLHNIIRKISLKPADQKEILKHLKCLSFRQEYWNPKNSKHVERAIMKLGSQDYPDSSWPIPYKTQVMFSSNRFQSILSAFGSQVPTLSLTSGSAVPLVKTRAKSTLTMKEGGRPVLPEMPIYIRPLDEASTAWKMVFDNHQLYVRYKRNREGIDGAAKSMKLEDVRTQELFNTLMAQLPDQSTNKKRKATDSEEGVKQDRIEKRQKRNVDASVASSTFLMSRLGLATTTVAAEARAESEGVDEVIEDPDAEME